MVIAFRVTDILIHQQCRYVFEFERQFYKVIKPFGAMKYSKVM